MQKGFIGAGIKVMGEKVPDIIQHRYRVGVVNRFEKDQFDPIDYRKQGELEPQPAPVLRIIEVEEAGDEEEKKNNGGMIKAGGDQNRKEQEKVPWLVPAALKNAQQEGEIEQGKYDGLCQFTLNPVEGVRHHQGATQQYQEGKPVFLQPEQAKQKAPQVKKLEAGRIADGHCLQTPVKQEHEQGENLHAERPKAETLDGGRPRFHHAEELKGGIEHHGPFEVKPDRHPEQRPKGKQTKWQQIF